MSVLGFKARVDSLACMLPRLNGMDSSDFTSGATPADLLVSSMVAEPFHPGIAYKHWWISSPRSSMPLPHKYFWSLNLLNI